MKKIRQLVTYELHLIKLLSMLIIFLVGIVFVVHTVKKQPTFYSYSKSKDLTQEIISLEQPNITTAGLLQWATFAITSIYTMDFVYYEKSLQDMREFFTTSGYQNYMTQLKETNKIKDISEKKLVESAVLDGTPVVLSEDILNGLYTWKVIIPLLITYQGASQQSTQESKMITALVIKDPQSPKGIGIAQIIEQVLRIS